MPVADASLATSLVQSLRSGLLAIDADGRIALLNDEGARILGLGDPQRQLGTSVDDALVANGRLAARLRQALGGQEIPTRAELQLTLPGAAPRTVGFTVAPIRDGERVTGAAVLFRDLTRYERADEQERLRDRLAALGEMAAGMAHEIRNPLASIELLAGLIKREATGEERLLELVEELQTEVRAVGATVRAGLDFVRPRAAARQRRPVRPVLDAALLRARARVPFAGSIDVRCVDELHAHVDPDQLATLLANLLINALEAMAGAEQDGAHVLSVALAAEGEGGLRVEVSDTGPGVPPELRERIFYPFFTTRPEGTGVGLAEVQKLAVAHGGTVQVDAGPEGGGHFTVHLPGRVEAEEGT